MISRVFYEWRKKDEPDQPAEFYIRTALKAAAANLRNDREVVQAAVVNSFIAFPYASEELQNDEDFVLQTKRKSLYSDEKYSD